MNVVEEKMPSGRRNGATRTMMSRAIFFVKTMALKTQSIGKVHFKKVVSTLYLGRKIYVEKRLT
jgi:hypothetical protein